MGLVAGATVSDIERELGGESRTLRTLEALLARQPERKLRLVIGADVLHDRHKWHRWDRVAELAPPIVLGRAGVEHPEAPLGVLPEVSSTTIRRAYRSGAPGPVEPMVPAAVRGFIAEHRLYAGNGDRQATNVDQS